MFLSWRGATTFAFTFCCHSSFCFSVVDLCSTLLRFILTFVGVVVVIVGN